MRPRDTIANKRAGPSAAFHPWVSEWFARHFGAPTQVQALAWEAIPSGRHCLVTAPTGSGKTLAAFLWALDSLLTGRWPCDGIQVLYLSPMKALNSDIERNLTFPLKGLEQAWKSRGATPPSIKTFVRSGDTPASRRASMLRSPPAILITTPESLNLLLASPRAREHFGSLKLVILDEVHAIADDKRGVHLMLAVERLTLLAGEFQRVALSATCHPLRKVADFVGGYTRDSMGRYQKRLVTLLESDEKKKIEIRIQAPPLNEDEDEDAWLMRLARSVEGDIRRLSPALVFCNSRRFCEKLTHFINMETGTPLAFSHHGSLSRELRQEVEARLKGGELPAVVATATLELGIDIGDLEQVILVQSPPTVASCVQRLGRAGHSVGKTSRGKLYPTHGRDFLDAVVVASCAGRRDIEPLEPTRAPLDVLAQVIIAMTAVEPWHEDDLFAFIRTCESYHELERRMFDAVLDMLTGRHAATRIRELSPRLFRNQADGLLKARPGSLQLLYRGGGTIPDRGYFELRHIHTGAKLGELDEEFVWERSEGDRFAMGNHVWRIVHINDRDVKVEPGGGGQAMLPFWRAESRPRSFHLAERIALFLQEFEVLASSSTGRRDLEAGKGPLAGLDPQVSGHLRDFLFAQRRATGVLPHRRLLMVEHVSGSAADDGRETLFLHTFWGGRVNRPLAFMLQQLCKSDTGHSPEIHADDDSICIIASTPIDLPGLLFRATSESPESLLRSQLGGSGLLGAHFRECAGRALLLPRHRNRQPLWLTRLKAKQLYHAVSGIPDFPIVLEAWRECLQEEFDLQHLSQVLKEFAAGEIALRHCRTELGSPFTRNLRWNQVNELMYATDAQENRESVAPSLDLVSALTGSGNPMPSVPAEIAEELRHKLQRTHAGYAPGSPEDLAAWLKDRLFLPQTQWEELKEAMGRPEAEWLDSSGLVETRLTPSGPLVITHPEVLRMWRTALDEGAPKNAADMDQHAGEGVSPEFSRMAFLGQWLQFMGPCDPAEIAAATGWTDADCRMLLLALERTQTLVEGLLVSGSQSRLFCDRQNWERLLRMARARRRQKGEALSPGYLAPFLAAVQQLGGEGRSEEDLLGPMEKLLLYPSPAFLWEASILPARLGSYQPAWLDALIQGRGLRWLGAGTKAGGRIRFLLEHEMGRLIDAPGEEPDNLDQSILAQMGNRTTGCGLAEMSLSLKIPEASLEQRLWHLAWRSRVSTLDFATLRRNGTRSRGDRSLSSVRFKTPAHGQVFPARGRWKQPGSASLWWAPRFAPVEGILDREARRREKARQALLRYGILFRELLEHEAPEMRWRELFSALRLMELSGEALGGHFFEGIPGPQFLSPDAFTLWQSREWLDRPFWLSAADPASPCGLGLPDWRHLPARLPGTHLAFQGSRLLAISRKQGCELELNLPESENPYPHLNFYRQVRWRLFPGGKLPRLSLINGVPAWKSPWTEALVSFGFEKGYRSLEWPGNT